MQFKARNYNWLAPKVYATLAGDKAVDATTRNGPVRMIPEVVTLTVTRPHERVNFSPIRDANPFFHLVEAMAMLTQHNSVKLLSHFASNMANFSDDGVVYNAFYGTRIGDQLELVVAELKKDPDSRRAVVQIWDKADLTKATKDKACNLCLLFSIEQRQGCLEMTSYNRSNDAIWGIVTGANVVHLSFFHEYVAQALGLPMGKWQHVTNNLHVYKDNPKWPALRAVRHMEDAYSSRSAFEDSQHFPMFVHSDDRVVFIRVVRDLLIRYETCIGCSAEFVHTLSKTEVEALGQVPFVSQVLLPALVAHQCYKIGRTEDAKEWVNSMDAWDWKLAMTNWLDRRAEKGGAK